MAVSFEKENVDLRIKVYELEKSIQYYKEKYVSVFLENHANEELITNLRKEHKKKSEHMEYNFMERIKRLEKTLDVERKREVKSALQTERNSPRNNIETKHFNDKLHKSDTDMSELKKLLDLEKEKVLKAEKSLSSQSMEFEKEKKKMYELEKIFDFEQLIILERGKTDKEKEDIREECLSQNQELSDCIAKKQKALDEAKKLFAIEK
ncbi:uncharacterized protein LOC112499863 [Cynara cardunculus var. scolymus]|uniref:uncharacterized protein LOC112499863 n=1 Tax=Cynara cardunculus var. scolymus TaxID=59895 RepID=UPI000D629DA5|nr:uncharacterized protein LOC112499863 [Cynara cardunculus var. scolymus]